MPLVGAKTLMFQVLDFFMARTQFASPSCFNFLMFAPIFSVVSIAYLELAPRYTPWAARPFACLAVEATNAIFYFSGFIALAVFLAKVLFCNGIVCAVARSMSVVAAAEFATWIGSTILVAKQLFVRGLGNAEVVGTMKRSSAEPSTNQLEQQPLPQLQMRVVSGPRGLAL